MNKVYACIDGLDTTTAVIDWAAWSALRLEVPLELLHVLERAPEMPHVGDYSGAIGLGAQEVLLQQLSALDEQRGKMAQEAGRQMLASARERLRFQPMEDEIDRFWLRVADPEQIVGGAQGSLDTLVPGGSITWTASGPVPADAAECAASGSL